LAEQTPPTPKFEQLRKILPAEEWRASDDESGHWLETISLERLLREHPTPAGPMLTIIPSFE